MLKTVSSVGLYFVQKLGLFLVPLQSLCWFYKLSSETCCFSHISFLLLLFFLPVLLHWSSLQYCITKFEGQMYYIILFLFSLKFSVVSIYFYDVCYFQLVIQFFYQCHLIFRKYQISYVVKGIYSLYNFVVY